MEQDLRFPIGRFGTPTAIITADLKQYISRIEATPENLKQAVAGLSHAQLDTPYRPGGWTVRQLVHHIPDSHLNCYVRFHWTLTEDQPQIKAYDEKGWAELPYLSEVPIQTSLDLLSSLHTRWVVLLKQLTKADLDRSFVHPEDGEAYSLRQAMALYAWHGDHHVAHITALRKRMDW